MQVGRLPPRAGAGAADVLLSTILRRRRPASPSQPARDRLPDTVGGGVARTLPATVLLSAAAPPPALSLSSRPAAAEAVASGGGGDAPAEEATPAAVGNA